MKAAVLSSFGEPLTVRSVPEPCLGTGEVIVDVVATGVLPYTREVLSGARKYALDLPIVPGVGAVGRVRALGPDSTRLAVGDWVFCDPVVRSRDDAVAPDIALQGWSARGDGGMKLQRYFHDGSFAEQMLVPTESAIPIGPVSQSQAARWCALGLALVPYGGLLAAALVPGETVLVSGATGNYGSAGVAVALSISAAYVIAPGRNDIMLEELSKRFGARVRTAKLVGDPERDRASMLQAANGRIDCVLDLLPPSAGAETTRTASMTVSEFGRVVLMGGVGMLGGDELALPYPWIMRNSVTIRGQWMYPRSAVPRLIALARAGLLDLGMYECKEFALDRVREAVENAAGDGAFRMTVLRP